MKGVLLPNAYPVLTYPIRNESVLAIRNTVRSIYPRSISPRLVPAFLPVRAFRRCAIVAYRAGADLGSHAVRYPVPILGRHAVVGAVEAEVGDAVVALDTGGLLHAGGEVLGDFAEDGDLALDDLFALAVGHVAGHVAHETLLGVFVEDLLVKDAWGVKVFGADFAKEGDGVAGELAMDLVEVDGALTELNGFDGREIIGSRALVEESHVTVALEVGNAVVGAGRVDG